MSDKKVIVVTGSNKGIGKSIVKQLILNANKYNSKNFIVYVTSRNLSLGTEVVEEFNSQYKSELESKNIELKKFKLDISNYDEVNTFKEHLVKNYQGVDVLINNAGVYLPDVDFSNNKVPPVLKINYYDTLHMIETFLPIVKPKGRLLTVSSGLGNLNKLPENSVHKFLNKDLTIQKVTELMENYIESARNNKLKENGWSEDVNQFSVYCVSKLHITAVNYALQLRTDPNDKLILACCPGYCATDLNQNSGPRPADEGALTMVHLALENLDTIVNATSDEEKLAGRGVFWQDMIPKPWNGERDN